MAKTTVTVAPNGRLVIPIEYRRALGVEDGGELLVRFEDGELRLTTRELAVARARALVRRFVPEGTALADELLAVRHADGPVPTHAGGESRPADGRVQATSE